MINRLMNFFRLEKFHAPTQPSWDAPYKELFEKAIRFTEKCGFATRRFKWLDRELINPDGEFSLITLRNLGITDPSASAVQCLKWAHYLQPELERTLDTPVWLTIGQLWTEKTALFNPSYDDLQRWTQNGIQHVDLVGRSGVNLHAWLTLESGEIIEPTLLSSLAKLNPGVYGKYAGAWVWGRERALNNHRYYPMLVGQEAGSAIGDRSIIPLLARNVQELEQLQMVVI